jgi:hypothetical protein
MPYNITWKPGGVIWTFHGEITGQEAIQANKDIYGDPRFDDLRYQIVDLLGVERFNLPTEDLEAAAAMDEAATLTNPSLLVTVVATEKEALNLANVYKSAMRESSWNVEIFSSIEAAEAWIHFSCEG